jgi:hypothetical protein
VEQHVLHLLFAPLLVTVLWDGLFSKFDLLDSEGHLNAHRRIITGTPDLSGSEVM